MTSAEQRLVATGDAEQRELDGLARRVIESQPSARTAITGIVERFVRETGGARRRVAAAGGDDGATVTGRASAASRGPAPLGYGLLAVTLLTSMAAAAALLPPRASVDVEREDMLALSIWSAWIAVGSAVAGLLLPSWGGTEIRRQAWQLHLVGAIALVGGLAWSLPRLDELAAEAGSDAVSRWLLANAVAVIAVSLGGAVRYLRRHRTPATAKAPDLERAYFDEIAAARSRAAAAMTDLLDRDRAAADEMERRWRAGIDEARGAGRVSPRSASRARQASAARWHLEAAADPDYRS